MKRLTFLAFRFSLFLLASGFWLPASRLRPADQHWPISPIQSRLRPRQADDDFRARANVQRRPYRMV